MQNNKISYTVSQYWQDLTASTRFVRRLHNSGTVPWGAEGGKAKPALDGSARCRLWACWSRFYLSCQRRPHLFPREPHPLSPSESAETSSLPKLCLSPPPRRLCQPCSTVTRSTLFTETSRWVQRDVRQLFQKYTRRTPSWDAFFFSSTVVLVDNRVCKNISDEVGNNETAPHFSFPFFMLSKKKAEISSVPYYSPPPLLFK